MKDKRDHAVPSTHTAFSWRENHNGVIPTTHTRFSWLQQKIAHTHQKNGQKSNKRGAKPAKNKKAQRSKTVTKGNSHTPDLVVLAYHFCSSNDPDSLKPCRFVQSIAAFFARVLPSKYCGIFNEKLLGSKYASRSPLKALVEGMLIPLAKLKRTQLQAQKVVPRNCYGVLLVNSLDTAEEYFPEGAAITIPQLLEQALPYFPPWLKLVGTAGYPLRDLFEHQINIDSHTGTAHDVERHIQLHAPSMRPVDRSLLTRTACGNFIFLDFILNEWSNKRGSGEEHVGKAKDCPTLMERLLREVADDQPTQVSCAASAAQLRNLYSSYAQRMNRLTRRVGDDASSNATYIYSSEIRPCLEGMLAFHRGELLLKNGSPATVLLSNTLGYRVVQAAAHALQPLSLNDQRQGPQLLTKESIPFTRLHQSLGLWLTLSLPSQRTTNATATSAGAFACDRLRGHALLALGGLVCAHMHTNS